MEYTKLVEKLSQKTEIDKDIFDLPELNNPENKDFIKEKKEKINNFYCTEYYYSQRFKERWKSVTLIIPKGIIKEFLTHLKDIYIEENEEPNGYTESDIENELAEILKNIVISEGVFRIVYRKVKGDDYYTVEFAKKDKE